MKVNSINIGDIFDTNNYGKFKIISESNKRRGRAKCYDIKFLKTGYERKGICRQDIIRGEVKDYYFPSIAGVGYLGEAIRQKDYPREYSIWKHMLHRCYNTNADNYSYYGETGVTVCNRWHCFKNFVEDICMIDGYDEKLFHDGEIELDKDLQCKKEIKEYNIVNCTFLSRQDNLQLSKFKKYAKVRKFNLGFVCKHY